MTQLPKEQYQEIAQSDVIESTDFTKQMSTKEYAQLIDFSVKSED
jgi:hypothetical protein